MIPKIIHRTIPFEETQLMKDCWESSKKYNQDFEHITHYDDGDYPLVKDYLNLPLPGALRADLIRLDVLYHHGGIYIDSDIEVKKSFNSLINQDFFITRELIICNAVIGAEPNNEIILEMIELSKYVLENNMIDENHLICEVENGVGIGYAFGTWVPINVMKNHKDAKILPKKSFYIYDWTQKHKIKFGDMSMVDEDVYGQHHAAGSWCKV